jgi:hypothetical protein
VAEQDDKLQRYRSRFDEILARKKPSGVERSLPISDEGGRRVDALGDQSSLQPEVPRGTLGKIMKGLRTAQQYTTLGPALAVQQSFQEDTPLTLGSILRSGREASREDLSFRDLATRGGLEGRTATALGLAGDIVLDPLNFLAPLKVAQVAGRTARLPQLARRVGLPQAVAAAKETAPAKFLGKHFVTDYGKPEAFVDLQDDYIRGIARRKDEAEAIGKRVAQFSPEDQRVMKEWLESSQPGASASASQFQKTLAGPRDRIFEGASQGMKTTGAMGENILDVASDVRDASIGQFREGVTREVFQAGPDDLEGRYLMRLYEEIEEGPGALSELARLRGQPTPRVRSGTAIPRLPPEKTAHLTRLKTAALPAYKGQLLTGRLLETTKFFDDVAETFSKEASEYTSKQAAAEGFKLVPENAIYGALKNRYIPDALYEDIIKTGGTNVPGSLARMWQKGVGAWKYGKIVLNPATHSRNITGNLILAHMAGLAPWKVHRYVQSARSLAKKDEFYDLAKKHGTFLTDTFVDAELPHVLKTATSFPQLQQGMQGWLGKLKSAGRKAVKAPAIAYQSEEQFFKQAFFIDQMQKAMRKAGKSSLNALSDTQKASFAKSAGKAAEQALFNYRKLPAAIDKLRRWGIVPFIAFPTKAAAATIRTLGERPGVLNQYGNIIRAFEPSLQEQARERSALPEYMQENWMRLSNDIPFIDAPDGEPLFMNMEYVLPWAELGDIGERLRTGDWRQGFLGTGGQEPAFLNVPALKIAASVYSGEDAFTGRSIDDYPGGAAAYYFDQLVPPLVGRQGRELALAARGERLDPRRPYLPKRSLTSTIAGNIFGARAVQRNIQQEEIQQFRRLSFELSELRRNALRIQRRGAETPREVGVMQKDLQKNMDEHRDVWEKIFKLQHGRAPGDIAATE